MITGINHLTLAVAEIDRSFDFYVRVLGCDPVARWSTGAYLTAGGTWLALVVDDGISETHRPDYSHVAFSCDQKGFDRLVAALRREGCDAWSENRSEGDSFYFCDPDGHKLEIHVGDLQTRLAAMRKDPWDQIEFFTKP